MKALLSRLPSALLVLLFVYAAAGKLFSFSLFRVQLHRQPFPGSVADMLLFALPAAELAVVVLLLFRRLYFAGLLFSLVLLYFFTGYIMLVVLHFWSRVPCPCGGILNHLSWTAHLLFNGCFIVLNLTAIHIHHKERRSQAQ